MAGRIPGSELFHSQAQRTSASRRTGYRLRPITKTESEISARRRATASIGRALSSCEVRGSTGRRRRRREWIATNGRRWPEQRWTTDSRNIAARRSFGFPFQLAKGLLRILDVGHGELAG